VRSLKVAAVSPAGGRRSPRPVSAAAAALAAALTAVAVTGGPTAAAGAATRPDTLVRAADPAGTPLFRETFTGATAPEFIAYNEACLTGAPQGAPPPGDHAPGGCEHSEQGPVPPLNAAPYGYLRLTDAGPNRTAAVLYNNALPATEGLDVTFDVWQYGGNPNPATADGVSFFLTDGEASLTTPGAFGGSLGYAKKQPITSPSSEFIPGVADGYLGVGLDVLGNYFADTEQRGYGCPAGSRSPAGQPSSDATFNDRGPNMVTVRGPGNGIEGYCYITATTNYAHSLPPGRPWPSNLPGDLHGPTTSLPADVTPQEAQGLLEVSRRQVNVRLTPAPDPRLIVTVDFGDGPLQVLDVAAPPNGPSSYKFGFAASTGSFADVHLIRNVVISSDRPLPELNLIKQVAVPRPGHLAAGDPVNYEFVVTNGEGAPITGLHVNDPVIGTVDCPVTELEPTDTVTCTARYTVKAEDVARGFIDNTAVATGDADSGPVSSPPDSEHLVLIQPPSLVMEKLVDTAGPFHAGKTVRYSYLVSNTGGTTLDKIRITDDRVTGITCEAPSIAPAGSPGDSTTCHGSYVITAADVFTGLVTNTATASGDEDDSTVTSPPMQVTVLIGPARLKVRKQVLTPGPVSPGETVRYAYTVTNTGTRMLHGVSLVDDRAADVACAAATLAPGQSTLCHGTYRVTAADVGFGKVTNFAQAEGTDSGGDIFTSDVVTATVAVVPVVPVTG
jgi:ethanolamine utilization microcompartment shell protein EutS